MEQQNGEMKRERSGEMTVIWNIIGSVVVVLSVVVALFDMMNSNINRVNDALLVTNATIAELANESAAQNAAQNAAIRTLSDDVEANGEAIAANGKSIADMNNRVGNGEVRLDSVERRLSDVDEMDDRLDDLEQGQSGFLQSQAELREIVDALIAATSDE